MGRKHFRLNRAKVNRLAHTTKIILCQKAPSDSEKCDQIPCLNYGYVLIQTRKKPPEIEFDGFLGDWFSAATQTSEALNNHIATIGWLLEPHCAVWILAVERILRNR